MKIQGGGGNDRLIGGFDGAPDDIYDGTGDDTVIGGEEDVFHRCVDDGEADNVDAFAGVTVNDPDC